MAIVKYGSIVTEIRGKLGSHVFQKSGQSLSMRTQQSQRFTPSAAGQLSKRMFLSLTNIWAGLSTAQKQTYTDMANTYPTTDRFGNVIVLTGYQLFIYINRSILNVSNSAVQEAVAFYNLGSTLLPLADIDISAQSLAVNWSALATQSEYYLFYVSNYLKSDCKVHNPKTKYLTVFHPAVWTTYNLWNHLAIKLGRTPILGDALYIEVWEQSFINGVPNRLGVYKINTVA